MLPRRLMKFALLFLTLCFSVSSPAASNCDALIEKVSQLRMHPPLGELASAEAALRATTLEIENRLRGDRPEVSVYQGPAVPRWRQWLGLENRWIVSGLRGQEKVYVKKIQTLQYHIAYSRDLAELHALMPEFFEGVLADLPLAQTALLQPLADNWSRQEALTVCRQFIDFYRESSPASGTRFASKLKAFLQYYYGRSESTGSFFNQIIEQEMKPRIAAWIAEKERTALEKLPVPIQKYLQSERTEVPAAKPYTSQVSSSDLLLAPEYWWFSGNIYHALFSPAQVDSEPAKATLPNGFELPEAAKDEGQGALWEAVGLFSPSAKTEQGGGDAASPSGSLDDKFGPASWESNAPSANDSYSDGGYSGGSDSGGMDSGSSGMD